MLEGSRPGPSLKVVLRHLAALDRIGGGWHSYHDYPVAKPTLYPWYFSPERKYNI